MYMYSMKYISLQMFDNYQNYVYFLQFILKSSSLKQIGQIELKFKIKQALYHFKTLITKYRNFFKYSYI